MADNVPVLKLIPVNKVLPSRHQARKEFSEESIKGLAGSIEKEGLLEPIMVRQVPAHTPCRKGFQLVANGTNLYMENAA